MPGTDPAETSPTFEPLPAYRHAATGYDALTKPFDSYRRGAVDLLRIRPGDVVLDVGCGTGRSFPWLVDRVGPTGTVVGVDPAEEMLSLARQRCTAHGWSNVVLIHSTVAQAALPMVDHALFCAVHDVLQSAHAVDHVVEHVTEGGTVAAAGGKWASQWKVALNACVVALHRPYVRSFSGFGRPWALLADRVPDLVVEEVALGAGYLASGSVQDGRS
jgi:SAM-dependent methyltransferase